MSRFDIDLDLSEQEILDLLRELEEEERMIERGDDESVAIVLDRRREKEELIDAMCQVSLPFYARYKLHMWVAEHHEQWSDLIVRTIDMAEQADRVRQAMCLLAPRDHGKSAWFCYALALWLGVEIYPGEYGAIVGEGDIAWTHLKHIKNGTPDRSLRGIMNTPELRWLRRKGSEGWTKDLISLSNGTEIFAKGAKSGWRGKHPRWLIVDDLLSQECIHSPTERKRVLENLKSALLPMVRGPVFIDGTPMHTEDIYNYCKKTRGFIYAEFPALYPDPETGEERALWPERFSVQQLHHIRDDEVGPLVFSREYMCKPISSLASLFPEEFFCPPVVDDSFTLNPPREWWAQTMVARFIAADIGISANLGSDYTVLWVIGIDAHGNRHILDVLRERGLGFAGIISNFIRLGVKYQVDAGIIESNQAQAFLASEAIRESPFPIETHQTGAEKHRDERGIPMLRLLFENKKYRLPHGDARSKKMMSVFIRELQAFTIEDGKVISTARHDDTVMAAWLLELLLRKMSFGGAWFDDAGPTKDEEDPVEAFWGSPDDEIDPYDPDSESELDPYAAEMKESFGTVYRGPLNPPDPNSPADYERDVLESFWNFTKGSGGGLLH